MDIRSHVIALNEDRARVVNELRAELDHTAGRERSAEEAQKIARLDARIDEIDAEVREFVARETREQEAAKLREQSLSVFGEAQVTRAELTSDQILRQWASGHIRSGLEKNAMVVNLRGAQRERELMRQGASADEIRALAWDTGSSASLVPTTLSRTLYEYMEASNGLLRAPTTKVYTASGEALQFPRLSAHAIATQVAGQGTTLAGTDPAFLRMELGAFKYGELVKVSNEVLSDSGIDIAGFLGRDLGRALGRITATAYVTGSGSGQPNGLMTAIVGSGTIATGGSLVTPTIEKLIDLQYSINDEYRSRASTGWLMNDSTAGTLRKLRDGAGGTIGAFLWEPSLTNGVIGGQPDRLLGHSVFVDSNVASAGSANKTVAFGDMSAFYIRLVGDAVVERDDSRYFDTDEVGFRAKVRTDSDLIDTTAVNAIRQVVA
jgi:HK97 family phage major capsid protein